MRHYGSSHVSSAIACGLEATLHCLDTHAKWDAVLMWRHDADRVKHREKFFRSHVCDRAVFIDWIKRQVVTVVVQAPEVERIQNWDEVQEILEAAAPFVTIPLSDEAADELDRLTRPNPDLWYEAVAHGMTETSIQFDLNLWGYKYVLENLSTPKDVFYILTDRLDARIRIRDSWTALDEPIRALVNLLDESPSLIRIGEAIRHEIATLSHSNTAIAIESACRSLFPLLERMLREEAASRGWRTKSTQLTVLIAQFNSSGVFSEVTQQLTELAAAPYRNVVSHGLPLTPPVARLVLVSLLECFVRVARDLDRTTPQSHEPVK